MAQTPQGGYTGRQPSPVGEEYQVPTPKYNVLPRGYQAYPGYPPAPGGYSGYGPPIPPHSDPPKPALIFWQDDVTQTFLFGSADVRRAFVRKVYSLLMIQLLLTLAIIALFLFNKDVQRFVFSNPWILWVSLGTNLFTVIALSCCTTVRRKVPMNYIFLFVFTINAGVLLGVITCKYRLDAVFLAVAITAAMCLALTLFALQTKWDFTVMGGVIICCLVALLLFGIISFFVRNRILSVIYACIGALVFCFALVYKTQLILGGKHKFSISPEEYVFAALSLYIDIINIFTYIFAIISGASGNES